MNTSMTRYVALATAFGLLATPLYAMGLDELTQPTPSATATPSNAAPKQTAPAGTTEPTPPLSKPATNALEQPQSIQKPGEPPVAPPDTKGTETAPANSQQVVATRSVTSHTLDERLLIGTSLGWSKITPTQGTWSGLGTSSINVAWRTSRQADGNLYITGRYTTYAGNWLYENHYYDTTIHGLISGLEWVLPFHLGRAQWKAGVELGYLMVYAKRQDSGEVDSKVKSNKASVGGATDVYWTILDKVRIGPFVQVSGGGFSIAQFGGAAAFVF